MTQKLKNLQLALRQAVLTCGRAQQIDIEGSDDKQVNAAETSIRVIANKQLPALLHDLMVELQILDVLEFNASQISVQYIIQVLASINSFPQVWQQCLRSAKRMPQVQAIIQDIHASCAHLCQNFVVLSGFKPALL